MRKFQVTVNGNTYEVEVAEIDAGMPGQAPVVSTPHVSAPKITPAAPAAPVAPAAGSTLLEAPMQGKIVSVRVSEGDTVDAGDVVAVLEAMKMENEIVAPKAGTVASVGVVAGQTVEAGDLIASLN